MRQTFDILGVKIDEITLAEAENKLDEFMAEKKSSLICTPNTEFIVKSQQDDNFRQILNKDSSLNLPDSYGIIWAGKFLTLPVPKTPIVHEIYTIILWIFSIILLPFFSKYYKNPIKEKISGSDFIWNIARHSALKNYRIFLFGGAPTVAERAALKLQTDIEGLRIGGTYPGDMTRPTAEIIEAISRTHSDILLVCLGAPLQENWITENIKKTGCKIGIGLGGTFDFTADVVPRAPKWMQRRGLEWVYRLIINPSRLGRQLALPYFMWLVLLEKLRKK